MTPQEPFEDIQEIAGVDALFDRLGARAPSPDDLDDPVVAALALMAAEIDLDAVAVDTTRDALASARPDVDLPPVPFARHDERTGLVIDLRDADRAGAPYRSLDDDDSGLEPPAPLRAHSAVGAEQEPRRPVRRGPRPEPGATAMAPPRSLPRSRSTRPGPGHPGEARARRLRPVTAAVIIVATLVLGSGVSAALTGGRSVNPLTGIQQVVAVLTGNRTQEQQQAYDTAQRQLRAAHAAVHDGLYTRAASILKTIDLGGLAPDDAKAVRQQITEVKASAHGRAG
jgi:hypothetical protein